MASSWVSRTISGVIHQRLIHCINRERQLGRYVWTVLWPKRYAKYVILTQCDPRLGTYYLQSMKQYYFVGISESMLWFKKVNSCFWFHFQRWLSVAVYWSQACNLKAFKSLICLGLEFHGGCLHADDDEDKEPSNHQVAINNTFACNVSIQKYDMCHNARQLFGSQHCVRMFCRFQSNNNQCTDCKHT